MSFKTHHCLTSVSTTTRTPPMAATVPGYTTQNNTRKRWLWRRMTDPKILMQTTPVTWPRRSRNRRATFCLALQGAKCDGKTCLPDQRKIWLTTTMCGSVCNGIQVLPALHLIQRSSVVKSGTMGDPTTFGLCESLLPTRLTTITSVYKHRSMSCYVNKCCQYHRWNQVFFLVT